MNSTKSATVALLATAGAGFVLQAVAIDITGAGATFPYGKDPDDRTIRIAPTFPELPEVDQAATGVALCVRFAASR